LAEKTWSGISFLDLELLGAVQKHGLTSRTLREKENYVSTLTPLENLNQEEKTKLFFIPFHLF
jgi:hypothetical protein